MPETDLWDRVREGRRVQQDDLQCLQDVQLLPVRKASGRLPNAFLQL
jgi:hypothetical protein